VEATLTALLTCAISMMISIGKAETCDSLRKGYEDVFKERYIAVMLWIGYYGINYISHSQQKLC